MTSLVREPLSDSVPSQRYTGKPQRLASEAEQKWGLKWASFTTAIPGSTKQSATYEVGKGKDVWLEMVLCAVHPNRCPRSFVGLERSPR